MESLAREHKQTGCDLIESGCHEDAKDLLRLAVELTADKALKTEIEAMLEDIPVDRSEAGALPFYQTDELHEEVAESELPDSDDDYFAALCSTLPEAEYDAYINYGEAFKSGYIALNHGDFEMAVNRLSEAMADHPDAGSYIPVELATAHLNRGDYSSARSLMDNFLTEHPESLKGYHLMCEIMWETKEFENALQLLQSCPEALSDSIHIRLLQGETLVRGGRIQEAVSFYRDQLKTRGWDDTIARSLATSCEAAGLIEEARDLYGRLMGACQGCGRRIDPFVKQRYADTSFEAGDYSATILELYLSLAKEDPDNRSVYFEKISTIYSMQGNETEARRFLSFAGNLATGKGKA